ncbi:TlpA family protein disulfide reductase [Streptacidiphilus sp. N1-12]|uniref:TlpA family protein disulfide reductase n=2 Tax=Streptacidiphilus alkalitolerans TaxID=3342712 RepID=A0ABV6VAY6_9ACTN
MNDGEHGYGEHGQDHEDVHQLLAAAVSGVRPPPGPPAAGLIARARRRRRAHRALGSAVCAAAVAAVAVGVVALAPPGPRTSGPAAVADTPSLVTPLIVEVSTVGRQSAPELAGQDLDGKSLSLAQYRGKVVLLTFWGSWCVPCRADAAAVEAVRSGPRAGGVQFLGVDTRDGTVGAAKQFAADHGLGFPSLYDPTGGLWQEFRPYADDSESMPLTAVVDRQGRVAAWARTPLTEQQLDALLAPVLAERP